MKSIVIYATRSGNTRRVAEQIAATLVASGDVGIHEVGGAPTDLSGADLVVIGGPTEGHGVTLAMTEYLDRIEPATIAGRPVAVFDTRLAWPRILSGAAADGIARRIRALGARMLLAPESFIVSTKPELRPGEIERAGRWAAEVARAVGERNPVGTGH